MLENIVGSSGEVVRAVRDVAVDRPRLVGAPIALVVHAPGVEAARHEPVHHRRVRPSRHLEVEGRGRGHGRAVHEEHRALRLVEGGRRLAPQKKFDLSLAGPVLGSGCLRSLFHGRRNVPIFYARIRRLKREEARMAIGTLDTFPKLLMHHAQARGARPAIREKDLGIWQTWTWREFADETRALACGLAAEGVKRGDHVALVSDNR